MQIRLKQPSSLHCPLVQLRIFSPPFGLGLVVLVVLVVPVVLVMLVVVVKGGDAKGDKMVQAGREVLFKIKNAYFREVLQSQP